MPNNNEDTTQEVTPGQAQLDSSITQKKLTICRPFNQHSTTMMIVRFTS